MLGVIEGPDDIGFLLGGAMGGGGGGGGGEGVGIRCGRPDALRDFRHEVAGVLRGIKGGGGGGEVVEEGEKEEEVSVPAAVLAACDGPRSVLLPLGATRGSAEQGETRSSTTRQSLWRRSRTGRRRRPRRRSGYRSRSAAQKKVNDAAAASWRRRTSSE